MDPSTQLLLGRFLEMAFVIVVPIWLVHLTRRAAARDRAAIRERGELIEIAVLLSRDEWEVCCESQYDQFESEQSRDDVWNWVLGVCPPIPPDAVRSEHADVPGFYTGLLTRVVLCKARATEPGTRVRFSVWPDYEYASSLENLLQCEILTLVPQHA